MTIRENVLLYATEHKEFTSGEVAEDLHLNYNSVRMVMTDLEACGLLIKVGTRQGYKGRPMAVYGPKKKTRKKAEMPGIVTELFLPNVPGTNDTGFSSVFNDITASTFTVEETEAERNLRGAAEKFLNEYPKTLDFGPIKPSLWARIRASFGGK